MIQDELDRFEQRLASETADAALEDEFSEFEEGEGASSCSYEDFDA